MKHSVANDDESTPTFALEFDGVDESSNVLLVVGADIATISKPRCKQYLMCSWYYGNFELDFTHMHLMTK